MYCSNFPGLFLFLISQLALSSETLSFKAQHQSYKYLTDFVCPVISDERVLYPYPRDCTRYYECHNGQAKEYSCFPGFYFNVAGGLCDFPENVQCAIDPRTSPSSVTTKLPDFSCPLSSSEHTQYAYPQDCTKYYECYQGQYKVYSCSPGFYFNAVEQMCDFPENVQCNIAPITSETKIPTVAPGPLTTKSPEFSCPISSSEHTQYAYPQDCTKYYECFQGQYRVYSCSPGFYFNAAEEMCDFPENVQCKIAPITSETKVPTVAPAPLTTKSPEFSCPISSSEHTQYAYPQDCTKYYECFQGQYRVYSCSPGFYFNAAEEMCDFPENVQCKIAPITSETKPPLTTKFPDFQCSVDGSTEHKRYPDPENCARYYECNKGQKILITCPPGFLFNNDELDCDFPDNVNCSNNSSSSTVVPSTAATSTQPTSASPKTTKVLTTSRPPTTTSAYPTSPSPKTTEVLTTSKAATTTEEVTTPKENPCIGKPEGSFLPHEDCRKFIRCAQGKAIVFTCALGAIWKEQFLTCVNVGNNNQC